MTDSRREAYEADKKAWIARQLETAPPLNERQKMLIQTAFAAARAEKRGTAA